MLIFELCNLLDHADENKHLCNILSCIPWFWFFVQKLGLYRITDGRPGKRIVSELFHYFIYSAIFKTGRKTGIGQAQQITLFCLQLIKKTSGKLWGQFGENFIIFYGMLWILIHSAPEASLELPTEQSMAFAEELKAAIRRKQILQLAV